MSRTSTFEAISEQLIREPKPFRFFASRLLWKSGLCRALTIRRAGYRLRFYPSAYSSLLWLDPAGNAQDEQVLNRILRPGDIVVDSGADIGTLTLCASNAVGETGRVYALEAHPRTFHFLKGNLSLNRARNVEAMNVAVGDSNGQIVLMDGHAVDSRYHASKHGTSVTMCTLDTLLRGNFAVRLLRIGTEGYELPVLRGASELLKRVQYVQLDCWDRHVERYGFRLRDALQLLRKAGLEPFRFSSKARLTRVRQDASFPVCECVLAVRDWRSAQDETGLEFEDQHDQIFAAANAGY